MPAWLDNAIFYEIYPQSFMDTNGDGIGDFQGIIRKLDYIKDLGFNAIWMNPCFQSPFTDAGYDVEDYFQAAPRYGTNEDLKELFQKAHEKGIRVILDLVPGHTSYTHEWFKESMKPEKNEYTHRYIWTDSLEKGFDGINNIKGSMTGISQRCGVCATNFFTTQPALNYGFYKVTESWQKAMDSPEAMATRQAMMDVMEFWLGLGCDGFRVDMAGSLVKNDEDCKGTIALWQDIMKVLKEKYPEAALISEWGEPDKSLEGGFHMDFLLHFGPSHYMDLFRAEHPYFSREGMGNVADFVKTYQENYEKTNGKGLICIPSGNHDMERIKKYLDEEEMKVAFAFLLSMPGAPFVYYGDEIGMNYVEGLTSVEGGYERTGSRTPMQWDDTANGGFSSAKSEKLYIRMDSCENRPTVKAQAGKENSLLEEVKRLNALRLAHPALQSNGGIEFLYAGENAYPLVYKRTSEKETMIVALNPSGKEQKCPFSQSGSYEMVYSHNNGAEIADGFLTMGAGSAAFFVKID